ncbi:MAG: DUF1302 domain-containing protein [Marinicellaceae bacterium]
MINIKRNKLNSAVKLAILTSSLGLISVANAVSFNKGDFNASWDTTISYGVGVRAEERDKNLVGFANLDPADVAAGFGRFSVNTDDGNQNYDKGDLISNALKITSEFGFSYNSFGGFFRATGFYDFTNNDKDELSEIAKEFVGKDFRLLDAYIYKDFDIGDRAASIRLGRQVVSWGESTFIQQGINIINPVDVSKIRVAGAELKEAFLPIDMIHGSFTLTDNLSMEALYMLEFEQIDPDPAGTYFSGNDFGTPGAEFVMLGFGLAPEGTPGATIRRAIRPGADDNGQYGLAFKYYSTELNDTEFGLYYLNYHSRLPLLSGTSITNSNPESGEYFVEYPEDIDLYGLSFNTTLNSIGVSLQGELSYRPNVPLQFDDVELLLAALSPLNGAIGAPYDRFISQLGEFGLGERIQGWERHEVSQFQMTATKLFGPNNPFKADQIVLLGEVGFTNVWDLPETDVLRYNGPGTDTSGGPSVNSGNSRNPVTEPAEFFATSYSWGYRLITRFDFNNAFGSPVNLSPRLAFNHDVQGTTPGPGGNFVEDRKSMTFGVGAVYLEKWGADISYTSYFGAGIHNLIGDRDFYSVNVKYSF